MPDGCTHNGRPGGLIGFGDVDGGSSTPFLSPVFLQVCANDEVGTRCHHLVKSHRRHIPVEGTKDQLRVKKLFLLKNKMLNCMIRSVMT